MVHTQRFRRRLAALVGLAALSGLLASTPSTTASFVGSTRNDAGTFTVDALGPPSGLAATVIGNQVQLAWSPGHFVAGGNAVGTKVVARSLGVEADPRDGDQPAACDESATFGVAIGRTAIGASTIIDPTAAGEAGSWLCYRVVSEYPATPAPTGFTSLEDNPLLAVQIGHVVRAVTLVDGGTPGDLRPGDAFVISFNQPVDRTTGPTSTSGGTIPTAGNDICVHSTSDAIVIARTPAFLNTNCTASNAHQTGKLAPVSMTPSGQRNAYQASYTWSDCEISDADLCSTMTATLGARYRGTTDVTIDATAATLTPNVTAGSMLAADGTALCSTSNNGLHTCRPVVTGSL